MKAAAVVLQITVKTVSSVGNRFFTSRKKNCWNAESVTG